jgi:indole-3-pyruvate monooxygenase
MDEVETLIIGAGAAGLAAAACLGRRGRSSLVLEGASAVGASWRARYRRLHLHTVKEHSALPGLPFPRSVPRYPSRLEVVVYLETYAASHHIQSRLGVAARRVRPAAGGFEVETDGGLFRARHLVVATGLSRRPRLPRFPGQESFRGEVLHSSGYVSPEAFGGRRVLVVGFGNSGAEIALDLAEHGATVAVAVRGGVNVMPRDFLGVPTNVTALLLAGVPARLQDGIGRLVSRLAFGDLTRHGLRRHALGPASQIARDHRIPVLDVGTIAAIRRGQIEVVPQVADLRPGGARCVDGRELEVDAIVMATGYDPGLDELLAPELLPAGGYPPAVAAPTPGLFFVGFHSPASGLLREIGREAEHVAAAVAG